MHDVIRKEERRGGGRKTVKDRKRKESKETGKRESVMRRQKKEKMRGGKRRAFVFPLCMSHRQILL